MSANTIAPGAYLASWAAAREAAQNLIISDGGSTNATNMQPGGCIVTLLVTSESISVREAYGILCSNKLPAKRPSLGEITRLIHAR